MLTYKGTVYRDVPEDARIVHARAGVVVGVAGAGQTYLLQDDNAGAPVNAWLFTPADVRAWLAANRKWEGRILGFNLGVHADAANAYLARQVAWGLERYQLDEAGTVMASIAAVELVGTLLPRPLPFVAAVVAEAWGDRPPEMIPFLPTVPEHAIVDSNTQLRAWINHRAPSALPVTTRAVCVATLALFPIADEDNPDA